MEKLFFIVLLLFEFGIIAQIKVKCSAEAGYLNEKFSLNIVDTYPIDGFEVQYNSGNVFYSDIILDFSIKRIHLEQQVFNMFGYIDGYSFAALEILYKTRLYYKYNSFSGGIEHMCLHPIINQHNELSLITRRGSYDKIFLRFTFEN